MALDNETMNLVLDMLENVMTDAEITRVYASLKFRTDRKNRMARATLRVGDRVTWSSAKTLRKLGRAPVGLITNIKVKRATVAVSGGGTWTVPLNMLVKAEEKKAAA